MVCRIRGRGGGGLDTESHVTIKSKDPHEGGGKLGDNKKQFLEAHFKWIRISPFGFIFQIIEVQEYVVSLIQR